MVTLDLLRVDKNAQGPLELESYLFFFTKTAAFPSPARPFEPKATTLIETGPFL